MTGFNHLAQSSQQQFSQQYLIPGNFNQVLPHQGNRANLSYPQSNYNAFPPGPVSLVNQGYGFRSVLTLIQAQSTVMKMTYELFHSELFMEYSYDQGITREEDQHKGPVKQFDYYYER